MLDFSIRDGNAEDLNFILDSWLSSFRESRYASDISNDIYYLGQKKLIFDLLRDSSVLVACNASDPWQIYGYLVKYENLLHFSFVKHTYRKVGVFRALFDAAFGDDQVYATHAPQSLRKLSKKFNIIYNPYLLIGA